VSNANTLIVDRADRMGLSQLHQLRGRVGRGRERAYAYFLYPSDKPLTETALERLRTIATNTDLGAGMQVAMKDLEIRGSGNLLGGEQSGHIAGVGFDLYVRMVSEAVAAYKKALAHSGKAGAEAIGFEEGDEEDVELRIELPVDATVPEDYIPHERLRLGDAHWSRRVRRVVDALRPMYLWDRLYLGGGNSRRITAAQLAKIGDDVVVVPNEAGMTGGARCWDMARP